MAYHHFASIVDMTRILVGFLKPGGALIIADLLKGGKGFKPHADVPAGWEHAVAHKHGFDEAEIKAVFEGAGLGQFTFNPDIRIGEEGKEMTVFVAKGVKA